MRRRIFTIIEVADGNDKASRIYDYSMLIVIIASLIPLAFKTEPRGYLYVESFANLVFIIDYLLRWATADYKFGKSGLYSFLRYPFTFMAIIDLLSLLPALLYLRGSLQLLRVLRVSRAFKALRYSKSYRSIASVFRRSKNALITAGSLALIYVLICALIIFNVEPETFHSFFDALYWAVNSLTTIGYGDIYPVSVIGRTITICSSIFGIAIVALPAGIITAGYMQELEHQRRKAEREKENKEKK